MAASNAAARRTRFGIRARLLLLSAASFLPFAGLLFWQSGERLADTRREVQQHSLAIARNINERLENHLGKIEVLMRAAGNDVVPRAADTTRNDAALARLASEVPTGVVALLAYDADGHNVGMSLSPASLRPLLDASTKKVRAIEDAKRTKAFAVGTVGQARGDSPFWIVTLGLPILRADSSVAGVIIATLQLSKLAPLIEAGDLFPHAVSTVLDEHDRVVARSEDASRWVGRDMSEFPAVRDTRGRREGFNDAEGFDGVRRVAAFTTGTRTKWRIVVGFPNPEVFAGVRSALRRDSALGVSALVLALIAAYLLAGWFARPITALTDGAAAIARGDLSHRTSVDGSTEIGQLARQFNAMADTIEAQTRSLRDNEERYRELFELSPLPTLLFEDVTFRFVAVNQAATRLYGWSREEFLAMTAREIRPPENVAAWEALMRRRPPAVVTTTQATHVTRAGARLEVEVNSTLSISFGRRSWIVVVNDVTQREHAERALRESQEQLRQMQKIEAVGSLAAGIAHDFNNLLTSILGSCDLASRALPPGSPAAAELQHARDGAVRATELTKRLLAFSRQQASVVRQIDVRTVVRGMQELLGRTLGEHVALELALDAAACPVMMDAGQLEQVVLNLLVNARDAMPSGGTVRVAVRPLGAEEVPADLPSHGWVLLAVSDDGSGMDDATRARIFEPFFTTKERGKGTGLGLSVVYGIVQNADGAIRVQSAPGAGTTFRVFLPLREKVTRTSGERVAATFAAATGSETLLLVEDEDAVRRVGARMLESLGYRVLSAPHAAKALEIAEELQGRIDLLVTDVIMPGMHGRELAEVMHGKWPAIRVLFVSGYTDDMALLRQLRGSQVAFLQKPFTTAALGEAVRNALDA